jgi:hypothetical protein
MNLVLNLNHTIKKILVILIMPFLMLTLAGCKSTTYSYGPNGYKVTERESGVGTRVTEEYYDAATGRIHQRVSYTPDKKDDDEKESKIKRIVFDLEGHPIFEFPINRSGIVIKGFYEIHYFKESLPQVFYTDLQGQKLKLLVLPERTSNYSDDNHRYYKTIRAGAKKISSLDSREMIRERFNFHLQRTGVVAQVVVQNFPEHLSGIGNLCAQAAQAKGSREALCSSVKIQSGSGETLPILIEKKFIENFKNDNPASSLVFTLKLEGIAKPLNGKLESAEIISDEKGVSGLLLTRFSLSDEALTLLTLEAVNQSHVKDPTEKQIAQNRSLKINLNEKNAGAQQTISSLNSKEAL